MSRAAWGGVMVLSLAATTGAAYFLSTQLNVPATAPAVVKEVPLVPAEKPTTPETPPTEPVAATATDQTKEQDTRNILFRFPRPSAKAVYIVGDFNKWKREPMTKGEKGWDVTIQLAPGSYQYLFVVDNKRTKDPNNKSVKDGKSVINVKPRSS